MLVLEPIPLDVHLLLCMYVEVLFIKSAHWADSFIESRCPLYVCMSVPFHVLYFEAYFAPTSQSRMSKNFRDSESFIYIPLDRKSQKSTQKRTKKSNRAQKSTQKVMKLKKYSKK